MQNKGDARRWDSGVMQRIQKARRAKNIKKFATHKQRRNLVKRHQNDTTSSVIVSSALGLPGASAAAAEEQRGRFSNVRKRERGDLPESRVLNNNNSQNPGFDNSEREDLTPSAPQPSDLEELRDLNHSDRRNRRSRRESTESKRECIPKQSIEQQNAIIAEESERGINERRQYDRGEKRDSRNNNNNPFQKELRRRDSIREARERQARRWAHEAAVQKKQQETSRKQRKQEVREHHEIHERKTNLLTHETKSPNNFAV